HEPHVSTCNDGARALVHHDARLRGRVHFYFADFRQEGDGAILELRGDLHRDGAGVQCGSAARTEQIVQRVDDLVRGDEVLVFERENDAAVAVERRLDLALHQRATG